LEARLEGLPEGSTIQDGVVYKRESFGFVSNGTLVRVVQRSLQQRGIWITNSRLSVLVLALLSGAFLLVMGAWRLRRPGPLQFNARGEFLYVQVVALIVLLAAPLTWVMNLVWLLPLIAVVLAEWGRTEAGRARAALFLAAAALVLIALPDGVGTPWMAGTLGVLLLDKYVIGEGLLLVSLLGYMPHLIEGTATRRAREERSTMGRT
jgi:hypothetical protein